MKPLLVRFKVQHLMIAVAVAAVALSVQGAIIVIALLVLVLAARRPHPVHVTTAILLTLLTGILLWANLRTNVWLEEFGGGDADLGGLDPITRTMFYHGWPLSPCMIWLNPMNRNPSGIEGCVLVFDGVLFLVALLATKAVSERCLLYFRRRNP
jgi:hypothetical protein